MSGTHETIEARVDERDGRLLVLSPAIGWWSDQPAAGAPLTAASPVGTIDTLNRRLRLVLPEGFAGRREGFERSDRRAAVEYGEILFELVRADLSTARRP